MGKYASQRRRPTSKRICNALEVDVGSIIPEGCLKIARRFIAGCEIGGASSEGTAEIFKGRQPSLRDSLLRHLIPAMNRRAIVGCSFGTKWLIATYFSVT